MALALVVLLGTYRIRSAQRKYKSTAPPDSPEYRPANFRLGIFYFNPSDDRFLVQKRFGTGFTFNMALWRAWMDVALIAAIVILSVGMANG